MPIKLLKEEDLSIEFRRKPVYHSVVRISLFDVDLTRDDCVIASCHVRDLETGIEKLVTFYKGKENPEYWGTEIYSGPNYIFGTVGRSWSKNYKKNKGLPKKYHHIHKELERTTRRYYDF